MTPNAKRARLVMDLMQLTGQSLTTATVAAGRIAEALFPDDAPAVYDPTLAGQWVTRSIHEEAPAELERVRAPLIAGQALIVVPPEGAVPRAIFENMHGKLRTKIAELTSAVEHRDRRIAEITHEKNELIKERDAARERAEGWKDMHDAAHAKLNDIEAIINGNAVVRSVGEEASE